MCKYNSSKAKQIAFDDISIIDVGKNSLKLTGTGLNFKISNIANVESIQAIIIGKKKATQVKPLDPNVTAGTSNADELKKYKELLDAGVISAEEFDKIKKQLLGL